MIRPKKAAKRVSRKKAPKRAVKKAANVDFRKSRVVTVYWDEKKKEWRVDTPEAGIVRGGTVTFRSKKAGRLTLFVPTPPRAAALFPRSRGPVIPVAAKGKTLTVSKAKISRPVTYTYSVYCNKFKAFAAASFPKIIVGP